MPAEETTPRVKVVQAQARRALRLAVAFGAAAAVAMVVPHRTGAWLPLHLFLVGALLLAISGATRLFTVTWSAGQPRGNGVVAVQRWLIAVGAAGLAVARERDLPTGVTAGLGLWVTAGLLLLGGLLAVEARSAKVRRFHPAVAFYLAAVGFGIVGTVLGAAMVTGASGVRDAHVIVNLLGLVGLVIAGTLPFFMATQARMKMSRRATAMRTRAALAGLAGGVTIDAVAAVTHRPAGVVVGLAAYAAGVAYLVTLLPRPGRKQLHWAGPRLVQLGAGVLWWIAVVAVAAVRAANGAEVFPEHLVVALVVGGYLQILVASLAYLGPVLRGGGHVLLSAGFATTRSWQSLVAGNVGAFAWLLGWNQLALLGIAVVAVDAVARAARLASSRASRPDARCSTSNSEYQEAVGESRRRPSRAALRRAHRGRRCAFDRSPTPTRAGRRSAGRRPTWGRCRLPCSR